ncbi:MAG TPA: uroporphyrinogen-III synthase [Tenuifilaceae bacterium]|nr:uroporphyrinogen-III synthase [Tenuifilaceae bacterium]HPI43760.1 uroporphyrinogen-III synthase [Tenuifilaceae bacterium]HPN20316.1 uroporphyrinogen-III synthase [Tenuifilaceae bacterium]
MKIKKVVISQPEPQNEKSPYMELAQKYGLKIDFRPFIHVEGVSSKEFRQQKINILDHTAVIFTSKTAVDHFFRICEEVRVTVPETMKYFCITESIALYLQKYIVYRKRKIFYGNNTFADLLEIMQKHKEEKYLLSLSDVHKPEIPKSLDKAKIKYTKAIFYKTVSSDLSDLRDDFPYEMIVFYSPNGIKSLHDNFPNFEQKEIVIGAFGANTAKAVKDSGLRLDVMAPTPTCPSMTHAIDVFLKEYTKKTK